MINRKPNDFLRNLVSNSYKTFTKKTGTFEYIEISNINLATGEYYSEVLDARKPPSRARKIVNKDDVIISTVRPNRNAVSIISEDKINLVASTGFCKLTAKKINPKVLFVLFKTSIYRDLLVRFTTATMYPSVNENNILNLKLPIFNEDFQNQVENVVNQSYSLINISKNFYSQAEQILLDELGLTEWKPRHKLSFIKNYSDTEQSGRIDAEYFQPKYEQIMNAVKKYKGGWDTLDNLVGMKKSIEPGSDEYQDDGVTFLRVSNLSKLGIDNGEPVCLSEKFFNENKQHQLKQGEILLSKDATPGIAYYLKDKPEQMIVSGGILRLTLKNEWVNEDYLTLVLNSIIVQEQAERDAGGSIIKHWRPDQIKKIVIPILNDKIQNQIQGKIRQSFDARRKSKELLEIAKKGVEMAIEKNEKTAKNWIEQELKKLSV
ncbi:MAG: hypothetical protein PHP01_00020 [Phycisphaerae bacterium]|nr:hypothetical protein [Phycisphaerae bacterium]